MSTRSLSRADLERAVRAPDTSLSHSVGNASAVSYLLRAAGRELHDPIEVARVLVRAGLALRAAHAVVGRLAESLAVPPSVRVGIAVRLPDPPDHAALADSLAKLGVAVERRRPPGEVDVGAIRARTGLTRDEFAARFGLDPRTVEGWEQGRFRPDPPTRTLLAVIDRDPAVVEAVLAA